MKVLQIVKTSIGGNWAFEQAKYLHDQGIDFVVVIPDKEGIVYTKYLKEGIPVVVDDYSLPIMKPLQFFKRAKRLRSLVQEQKPDVIHCHFVTNILFARLALRGSKVPRLFQVPGPLHLENWITRMVDMMTATQQDYWAGACKKTCDIYRKTGVAANRVFLAYYGGYGGEACSDYKDSSNILHRQYQLSEDNILIGMVSLFYKPKRYLLQTRGLKGHEDFIDAIAMLRKRNTNIVGIVIGGPWVGSENYYSKVRLYANKKCKDGIIFTGYRSDLPIIYRELDYVVHPSHSENLGGAAESLAAGVPTIATTVGGFPDIVRNNETGLLVPPNNPASITEAIQWMIEHPKESTQMAEAGRADVCRLLDIDATGKRVFSIYSEITGLA